MAFSKDPFSYHPEEQQALLFAISEDLPITCDSAKHAVHLRHRLYALRKAVVELYDKGLALESAGKPAAFMKEPLIVLAPQIRQLSINLPKDSTILTLGIGAAQTNSVGAIQRALQAKGAPTVQEQTQKAVEAVDFNAMATRLEQDTGETEEDTTLAELGFTPSGTNHSTEEK